MASVVTREFAKASERTATSPFCIIEQKGLLARLAEELSRAASDLSHDPRGFLHDLVTPADTKDLKRRRLVYIGLGCALVAHAVLLTLMIIAGWHRVLQNPGDPPLQIVTIIEPRAPSPPPEHQGSEPKGRGDKGGGGGGQQDPLPAVKADVGPRMTPLPPIIPVNVPSSSSPDSLLINPTTQGIETPPLPGVVGDPKGTSADGSSGGRGSGGGVGNGDGQGAGSGSGPGTGLGSGGNKGGKEYGSLNGETLPGVVEINYNTPPPMGYVQFKWLRRVTAVVTPEAQANKVVGVVLFRATLNANGTITDIEIVRQVDYMTESALEALKKCTFRPATINGKPTTVRRVLIQVAVHY